MKSALFLLVSGWFVFAQGNYSAVIYEQNSKRQKVLYNIQVNITPKDGVDEIHTVYKDPAGTVVVEEKSLVAGTKVTRYEIDHKQTNQKGLIEVKDGKVFFTKTTDGKTTTKDEKLGSTFVNIANFQKFIQENWPAISTGKTVSFRYGVWDRQDTVGFEIFKTGDDKIGEKTVTVLKMKPSSFLISALVKPIILKFEADGSHLLEMNGRVAPKKKDGSAFKDLDGEVVYTY